MNRSTEVHQEIEQRAATGGTYTKRIKKQDSGPVKIDYSFASFFFNGYFNQRREENTNETLKNIYPVL